ncbi:MAG: ATP-binding protein, partial [Sphingobacteriales bacterium]
MNASSINRRYPNANKRETTPPQTALTALNQRNSSRLSRLESLGATISEDYQNIMSAISDNVTLQFGSLLAIIENRFNLDSFERRILSNMVSRHDSALGEVLRTILAELSISSEKVARLINLAQERVTYINSQLDPYLQKITKKESLVEIQKVITEEEKQLQQIENLQIELRGLEGQANQTKDKIISDYERILIGYQKVIDKVNEEHAVISSEKEISLKAIIGFDKNRFAQNCTIHIDKRTSLSEIIGPYFDQNNEYIFVEDEHLNNVTLFFDKVLSNALRFNQSGHEGVVCERLFDDYFSVHFELYQKGESIFKMSPGKKGLILMYLILHLSNATYPILIDQPEDNLDNRTVYSELKEFLKSKQVLSATLKDDLFHYTLIFREDGSCENQTQGFLGFEETFHGDYTLNGDTIIFKKKPYDNNFIPDTLLIDEKENAIFKEKNENGNF